MRIEHIGRVPRAPVIELEGMGAIAYPGEDYDQAPWPAVSVLDTFRSYIHEHVIPRGGDTRRTCIGMKSWIEAEVTHKDAATITRADGRLVVQYDIARGVKPATARRNMAMGIAALNHAKREERIKSVPKFQIPDASSPRLRWLTHEEVARLLQAPKPGRIQRFILVGIHTGVRPASLLRKAGHKR